ncbi:orotidine 5'-phosphate decarboxylase [Stygiolobus caldivivus]|uniref:Orotidine 5'-phosphate decarboxylase n=1 Tax=Stygiolobus caldivivus TaxID=2824673 RepID=A0A8D5ZGZ1_9CREN|nr:orotidine 5'-phosphate decarboxylase [Stygiolobus caldivivus]BCU71383.1 orotidine 5'-phosphate decarboxylase [Stygiolobus caldivivus]
MSRIILALDSVIGLSTLTKIREYISRVKFSYVTLLQGGLGYLREVYKLKWDEVIFDLKLADIDSTMISIVSALRDLSDSFISHSFIGYEGALDSLMTYLSRENKGLYLVLSMSHKGWNDSFYPYLKNIAERVNPKGFVVGATRPEMIKNVRADFPQKIIISPGVGFQGAEIGDAICNGADFEIIGRSIYSSNEPERISLEIKEKQEAKINECKKVPKDRK